MKFWTFYLHTLILLLIATSYSTAQTSYSSRGKYTTTNVDLTHWKVTIPTSGTNGRPLEVSPPEIFNYSNNEQLKEFMYNDPTDGAIVFHAYPEASTANSKYSRSELREQMIPGNNKRNWTFKEGGYMKATMSVPEVSEKNGKKHRMIIAQIHGRLTDDQKKSIGQKDNNAPPILKVYWTDGKVRVKTKKLKNPNASDKEILDKKAWTDDEGYSFKTKVYDQKFTIEVIASEGKMEVVLNGKESIVYDSVDIERWGIFENYFKVGNYLITRDAGAYGKVKLYDLKVKH